MKTCLLILMFILAAVENTLYSECNSGNCVTRGGATASSLDSHQQIRMFFFFLLVHTVQLGYLLNVLKKIIYNQMLSFC